MFTLVERHSTLVAREEPAAAAVSEGFSALQSLTLYESKTRFLFIGSDKAATRFRIMTIDRTCPGELKITEDPKQYAESELKARMNELVTAVPIDKKPVKLCGILGFIRLPRIYMIVIKKKNKVGSIAGRYIYSIGETAFYSVAHKSFEKKIEGSNKRYKGLLLSLDFTKDFYFSYFYDLTHTLQHNMMLEPQPAELDLMESVAQPPIQQGPTAASNISGQKPATSPTAGAGSGTATTAGRTGSLPLPPITYNERFLWNLHLAREFLRVHPGGSYWLVPLIHGFFAQSAVKIGRHDLALSVIARRSRHFAGTRYIKRGIDQQGHVANEVETELLLHDRGPWVQGQGGFASFVVHRGSIPLFWGQDNPSSLKPNITIHRFDTNLEATQRHFEGLFQRYGTPVGCLNLIRQEEKNPQEMKLGQEFAFAAATLAQRFTKLQAQHAAQQAQAQARSAQSKKETRDGKGTDIKDGTDQVPAEKTSVVASSIPSVLRYMTYDFINNRKAGANVLRDLKNLISPLVEEIGFFYQAAQGPDLIGEKEDDHRSTNTGTVVVSLGESKQSQFQPNNATNASVKPLTSTTSTPISQPVSSTTQTQTESKSGPQSSPTHFSSTTTATPAKSITTPGLTINLSAVTTSQTPVSTTSTGSPTPASAAAANQQAQSQSSTTGANNTSTKDSSTSPLSPRAKQANALPPFSSSGVLSPRGSAPAKSDAKNPVSPSAGSSAATKPATTSAVASSPTPSSEIKQLVDSKDSKASVPTLPLGQAGNTDSKSTAVGTTVSTLSAPSTANSSVATSKPLTPRQGEAADTVSPLRQQRLQQKGLIRVNCIDCLDRTNVAQLVVAKAALRSMLRALGVTTQEDLPTEINEVLQDIFARQGDRIAHQYAGSGAMHKEVIYGDDSDLPPLPGESSQASNVGKDGQELSQGSSTGADGKQNSLSAPGAASNQQSQHHKKNKPSAAGIAQNAFSAVKRYYSNNVTDTDKQHAINLLLGNYIPDPVNKKPHLWDLDITMTLSDSDTQFGTENTFFKLPYAPYLLAGHKDKNQLSGEARESRKKAHRRRLMQFIEEWYEPSELTSFKAEFEYHQSKSKPRRGSDISPQAMAAIASSQAAASEAVSPRRRGSSASAQTAPIHVQHGLVASVAPPSVLPVMLVTSSANVTSHAGPLRSSSGTNSAGTAGNAPNAAGSSLLQQQKPSGTSVPSSVSVGTTTSNNTLAPAQSQSLNEQGAGTSPQVLPVLAPNIAPNSSILSNNAGPTSQNNNNSLLQAQAPQPSSPTSASRTLTLHPSPSQSLPPQHHGHHQATSIFSSLANTFRQSYAKTKSAITGKPPAKAQGGGHHSRQNSGSAPNAILLPPGNNSVAPSINTALATNANTGSDFVEINSPLDPAELRELEVLDSKQLLSLKEPESMADAPFNAANAPKKFRKAPPLKVKVDPSQQLDEFGMAVSKCPPPEYVMEASSVEADAGVHWLPSQQTTRDAGFVLVTDGLQSSASFSAEANRATSPARSASPGSARASILPQAGVKRRGSESHLGAPLSHSPSMSLAAASPQQSQLQSQSQPQRPTPRMDKQAAVLQNLSQTLLPQQQAQLPRRPVLPAELLAALTRVQEQEPNLDAETRLQQDFEKYVDMDRLLEDSLAVSSTSTNSRTDAEIESNLEQTLYMERQQQQQQAARQKSEGLAPHMLADILLRVVNELNTIGATVPVSAPQGSGQSQLSNVAKPVMRSASPSVFLLR